jgi:hypothetical protein
VQVISRVLLIVWASGCADDAAVRTDGGGEIDGGSDAEVATDAGGLDAASCDDDNPCTVDAVEAGACTHLAGNGGAPCRFSSGFCDVRESCDGVDPECPADEMQPTRLFATRGRSVASPLYVIDPADGTTIATIGSPGYAVTGLAFHPRTGVLYGVTTSLSPSAPQSLVTIDPTTGEGSVVGSMGYTVGDITFDRRGRLFGWAQRLGEAKRDLDDLVRIDIDTGSVTVVADSGLDVVGSGLAFGPDGRLYFAGATSSGDLVVLDPELGVARGAIGALGGAGVPVGALAFDLEGALYGLEVEFGSATLLRIDPATAATTTIGPSDVEGLDALAFGCF